MSEMQDNAKRNLGAIFLIAVGVLFLLNEFFNFNIWSIFNIYWPWYVILPGLVLLGIAFLGGNKTAAFSVPGMIVTGTGAILLYQDSSGNWDSWAYMWALYPVFVGVAIMFMGMRTNNTHSFKSGRNLTVIGAIVFAVFAAFFELSLFSNGTLWRTIVPLVLIGGGVLLLLRNNIPGLGEKNKRG